MLQDYGLPPWHCFILAGVWHGRHQKTITHRSNRAWLFSRGPLSTWSDQDFCRDAKPLMQATDHRDREPALSVQDLGDPSARADDLFQILSREPLLLHTELDRLDRIGRVHRVVLRLVRIDEGREHIQPIAFRSIRLR